MVKLNYLSTPEDLAVACKKLSRAKSLGIDLECENHLHRYGSYISLIQVSDETEDYIIDVLSLKEIGPLIDILRDSSIQKIFHDVGFDFRILIHQFGCHPKNVFDTQLAVQLLGSNDLGLASALENHFGIKKECKFQMADWTLRPLSEAMLEYASLDSRYLIRLRDKLAAELKKKGRLSWMEQECKNLETKEFEYKEGTYSDVKGYSAMTDKGRAILKRLFKVRDQLAQKVDRPIHFVIRTKTLVDLAQNPITDIKAWNNMKGVHPIVRKMSYKFIEAISKGSKEKITITPVKKKRFDPDQRKMLERLTDKAEKAAERHKMPKFLIASKDQLLEYVLTKDKEIFRPWQQELLF